MTEEIQPTTEPTPAPVEVTDPGATIEALAQDGAIEPSTAEESAEGEHRAPARALTLNISISKGDTADAAARVAELLLAENAVTTAMFAEAKRVGLTKEDIANHKMALAVLLNEEGVAINQKYLAMSAEAGRNAIRRLKAMLLEKAARG